MRTSKAKSRAPAKATRGEAARPSARKRARRGVAERVVRGPGGRYRLACTDLGLLLCELPAAGRKVADFRRRVDEQLELPRSVACESRDPELHADEFALWIEDWCGETAWDVFWAEPALDLRGTGFRRKVWTVLRGVPPGEFLTYSQLAERAGSPRASRAVGTAMRENPISLFVPCHRVVSAQGIGAFGSAGPGLKRQLLREEDAPLELLAS